MRDFILSLQQNIQHVSLVGYGIGFLLAFGEALPFIGTFIPGTSGIITLGFLSSQGLLSVYWLFGIAVIGAIIGDGLAFYLGKKGSKLFERNGRFLNEKNLDRGKRFFIKHGAKSVFFARFLAPVRAVVPFVAGTFNMSNKKFYVYNILSAIGWSLLHTCIGYFFGNYWKQIEGWTSRIGLIVGLIVVCVIIGYFVRNYALNKYKK